MTCKEYKRALLEYLEATQCKLPEGDTQYARGFHDGIDWVHEKVSWAVIEKGNDGMKDENKLQEIVDYLKTYMDSDSESIENLWARGLARERKIMALEMIIRFDLAKYLH